MEKIEALKRKLEEFIRKYYINRLLKGAIYALGLGIAVFLVVSFSEHLGNFDSTTRLVLLMITGGVLLFLGIYYLIVPLVQLGKIGRRLSHNEAAKLIGKHFQNIDDQIINTLQLGNISQSQNRLVLASIEQKVSNLEPVPFQKAVNFRENKKFLPILIIPAVIFAALLLFDEGRQIINSSQRVVKYEQAFIPPAPFEFKLLNESLRAEEGSDVELELALEGEKLPSDVRLLINREALRMIKEEEGRFSAELENLEESTQFQFQSGGYKSEVFSLEVVPVPMAGDVVMRITPPAYTGREPRTLQHKPKVTVAEGSKIEWELKTFNADSVWMQFRDSVSRKYFKDNRWQDQFRRNREYQITLGNRFMEKKATIWSKVDMLTDRTPEVKVDYSRDTTYDNVVFYDLQAQDDYGLSQIRQVIEVNGQKKIQKLPLQSGVNYRKGGVVNFDSIAGLSGKTVSLYFEAYDNDVVNGSKRGRSQTFELYVRSQEEKREKARNQINSYSDQNQKIQRQREKIDKQLQDLQKKTRGKEEMSWQDKQNLKEMLKQLEQLQKKKKEQSEKLRKNLEKTREKEEKQKEQNKAKEEKIKELTEEEKKMKKLQEEIQKMMKDLNKDKMRKKLQELQQENQQQKRKEERTEKMLEDLMFQRDLLRQTQKLEEMSKKMKDLSKKSEGQKEEQEQEEVKKEFEKTMKKLQEMSEKEQKLKKEMESQEFQKQKQGAQENMQKSKEGMKKGDSKQENSGQKKSGENMQKMSEQMQSLMMQMQQDAMKQNAEAARQILENLETFSQGVENVGQTVKNLEKGDPRFRKMLQEQNRLSEGAEIIEDSLKALAERSPQVKEKVFRELEKMQSNLKSGTNKLQNQKTGKTASDMQYSMMAANELALLLDKSLQNMMQMMAQSKPGNQNCQKPGGKKPGKSGKKKIQSIGKKIGKLKKGQKPGSGGMNGKQMAKILSEQEQLRKELRQMAKEEGQKGNKGSQGKLEEAAEELEEMEKDLVNENWDADYKKRLQRIETRMLESEEAKEKRKMKDERKARTAENELQQIYKEELEKYLKEKRTIDEAILRKPLNLSEFYKERAQQYNAVQ